MADKTNPKGEPEEEKQTTLRIPGFLWTRIQRAMEFEGIDNFTTFAHNSFTRNCRRIEIEKKREEAGLPPIPKGG